ncbi:MAG TPA: low-specificity L-threonine aldolase [Firmicutes bacterium]|nr:low-specificity L-threonine aldolase [Bacillota bacterium]HBT16465.1 low-specificity L-threonine aldolase [Bacillota bacterium]
MKPIDLRSDTVTKPTAEMRTAMAEAEVGDDVYGEDPTVLKLEEIGAEMIGKEAALFVVSGTMGNQTAAMTHLNRGDEVIVEADSHIFYYEVGGLALLSGAQARTIPGVKGFMAPEQINKAIRSKNIHFPRTGLLCLENTHNRAGGAVLTPEQTRSMANAAHERGVPIHLDGARIFNAALALGIDVRELTAPVDSVMFCLSKGLGAPVGSLLAGSRSFIERARKNRKVLGGGLRQAGILAAAGIIALEKMVGRLAEDHYNARILAQELSLLPGITINPGEFSTNIIVFSIQELGVTAAQFEDLLASHGVLANSVTDTTIRFVTHKDVSEEQIKEVVKIVHKIVKNLGK